MWQNRLRRIIDILESSDVNEIEVSFWGRRFRVSKGSPLAENSGINPTSVQETVQQAPIRPETISDGLIPEGAEEVQGIEVTSPMVGTFYRAPSPESTPFVNVGHHVSVDQTLCIIEAMKIMNEITSETTGRIANILVENAQPVEYGQILFIIEPD